MFAQNDTYGLVALGISMLIGAGTVIAFLFKLLIASKDNEIAAAKVAHEAAMKEKERLLAEKTSAEKSYKEVAAEAIRSAIELTNFHRSKEGKPPIIPLVPVVPEGHSPSDKKQSETADLATMRATMAQIKLASGQEPRREVAPEGAGKLDVLENVVDSAVARVDVVKDVVKDLVEEEKKQRPE